MRRFSLRLATLLFALTAGALIGTPKASAQTTGGITGTVSRVAAGVRLTNVIVGVSGSGIAASTGADGRFVLPRVPAGPQTLQVRSLGFAPLAVPVEVVAGRTVTVDITMQPLALRLSDVIVSTASRSPERIVEAPAAISVVSPQIIAALAPTGQVPLVLTSVPGVDIVQNGVNDFNINARGFNSSLTRRVLVLEDGRDVAIAFLGSQEWGAMGTSLEDVSRIEMVRGPGSALYGSNAFSGVLTMTSQTAREAAGSRITLAAGELSTRRADAMHAALFRGQRFGYKLAAGYSSSDTWGRSRTRRDSSDIVREYEPATDSVVAKSREGRPLIGQSLDPTTLEALGDRDAVTSAYGSARFDYYPENGSLATIEGGLGEGRNETFVTGLGRVQVARAQRPWARGAWASDRFNVLTWYTGRDTRDPQWALGSGTFFLEKSAVVHGEVQYNNSLPSNRGRYIVGVSARSTHLNTSQTLVSPANDDRTDRLYAAYAQVELRLLPKVKLVAASRWDDGNLFEPQLSPKAAVVFSPSENSSFRLSVNKAFQTANYSEYFLHANAAAPTASPRALETALEGFLATGRAIGTSGLPTDLPWNFEAATPVVARGNDALDVEKITGYELGYSGAVMRNGYLTLDLYWNDKRDFITDLLPNVNPAYPQYRYDDGGTNVPAYLEAIAARAAALPAGAISEAQRQGIIAGAQALRRNYDALVAGTQSLLTTAEGRRVLLVSYANAGRVTERGVEAGLSMQLTSALRTELSYALFNFKVEEASLGTDALLPNTPKHKGALALLFQNGRGLDLGASLRMVAGYRWAAGVFNGYVPAAQFVNANASWQANPRLKVFVTGTNVFDQRRFQIFGGSVLGRRVIGGVTAIF